MLYHVFTWVKKASQKSSLRFTRWKKTNMHGNEHDVEHSVLFKGNFTAVEDNFFFQFLNQTLEIMTPKSWNISQIP